MKIYFTHESKYILDQWNLREFVSSQLALCEMLNSSKTKVTETRILIAGI